MLLDGLLEHACEDRRRRLRLRESGAKRPRAILLSEREPALPRLLEESRSPRAMDETVADERRITPERERSRRERRVGHESESFSFESIEKQRSPDCCSYRISPSGIG